MRPVSIIALLAACAAPSDTPEPTSTTAPVPQPVPTTQPGPVKLHATVEPAGPNVLAYRLAVGATQPIENAEASCAASDDPADTLSLRSGDDWLLAGLRAGATYTCVVTADHATPVAVDVTAPPVDIGPIDVEATGPGVWTTTVVALPDAVNELVVIDDAGEVRFAMPIEVNLDLPASSGVFSVSMDGGLLVGGGKRILPRLLEADGTERWRSPRPVTGDGVHHDTMPLDGTLLELTWREVGDPLFTTFGIEEVDPLTAEVLWTFTPRAAVDAGILELGSNPADPFHANAVDTLVDPVGEAVWVSLRTSRILRIDRATGQVTHTLGEGGDFALLDAGGAPLPDDAWFRGQHDPSFTDGGAVLLMHDNGYPAVDPYAPASRILELALDFDALEARVLWEWTEPDWYEPVMGGVERLGDGRLLLTRAHCLSCGLPKDGRSMIQIVDPVSGSVPWRMQFSSPNAQLYRARSVDPGELFPALDL